ncbi:hypothetical protein ACOJVU_08735, partial [Mycobacterium sp. THU-M104]
MADLFGLDGRVVVVSGAGGGGIGTAVTELTARAGATVIAVSRSQELVAPVVGWLAHQSCSVSGEIFVALAGRVARA